MLPFFACLLLIASSLASDGRGDIPYDGSLHSTSTDTYPIDYNDEFRAPPKNPNSNIYFSFEQIRRDQSSQFDVRDEDVGRYMNRPKITTTTSTPVLVESREPKTISDVYMPPARVIHKWVDPSTTMAPPPPAPSPKWDGFDLDFRHSPFSQYKPRRYENVVEVQHPKTTATPVKQSSEQYQEPARYFIQPTDEPYVNQDRIAEDTTTSTTTITIPPHWTETDASTESFPMEHMNSRTSSGRNNVRGSYKFNWREPVGPADRTHPVLQPASMEPAPATTPQPGSAPTTPAMTALRKPPPPIPTLTPWAGDSY